MKKIYITVPTFNRKIVVIISFSVRRLDIEQSIDLALNSNHDIIIVGDFNNNQLNNNTNNKTRSLLTQYSFYQLIDEPKSYGSQV
jgi:hypothetical protein